MVWKPGDKSDGSLDLWGINHLLLEPPPSPVWVGRWDRKPGVGREDFLAEMANGEGRVRMWEGKGGREEGARRETKEKDWL